MTRVILIRHGNTFGPDDLPVWVGKNEDLPLVESGRLQASRLREVFEGVGIQSDYVFCSPLQRAKETAEELAQEFTITESLHEIDYGSWGGKTTEQLQSEIEESVMEGWDHRAEVPANSGWGSSEAELKAQVRAFISEVAEVPSGATVFAVTSNGFLKCFARFQLEEFQALADSRQLKVKTGHICDLTFHPEKKDGTWTVNAWGVSPEVFAERVSA